MPEAEAGSPSNAALEEPSNNVIVLTGYRRRGRCFRSNPAMPYRKVEFCAAK